MNQLTARHSAPRLDIFNAGGNRLNIVLPSLQLTLTLANWLYAKVVPSSPEFRVNPVTHALTACTGSVDGSKANMANINYLFALAEIIDPGLPSVASNIVVKHAAAVDTPLIYLSPNSVTKAPAWSQIVSPSPLIFPFTGTQTIFFDSDNVDTNLRVHLLMGCAA